MSKCFKNFYKNVLTLCGKVHAQQSGQHFSEILTSVQPLRFETLIGREKMPSDRTT